MRRRTTAGSQRLVSTRVRQAYVVKPFSPSALVSTVRSVLAAHEA